MLKEVAIRSIEDRSLRKFVRKLDKQNQRLLQNFQKAKQYSDLARASLYRLHQKSKLLDDCKNDITRMDNLIEETERELEVLAKNWSNIFFTMNDQLTRTSARYIPYTFSSFMRGPFSDY